MPIEDERISELDPVGAESINDTDELVSVSAGVTVRMLISTLKTFILSWMTETLGVLFDSDFESDGVMKRSDAGTYTTGTIATSEISNDAVSFQKIGAAFKGFYDNSSATGTVAVDWSLYSIFDIQCIGNTTIEDDNISIGMTKEFRIRPFSYSLTLPSYWRNGGSTEIDVDKINVLTVSCYDDEVDSENVIYTVSNYTP